MRTWTAALLGCLVGVALAWVLLLAWRPSASTVPVVARVAAPTDTVAPAPTGPSAAEPAATGNPAPHGGSAEIAPQPRWPDNAATPEQVLYDQPRLMDRAIAALKPQTPGKVDLYLLAFAGDGGEDVFRNEAEYAAKLFAIRFGASGHTLVLENNPRTVGSAPLATWTNLETALTALHGVMDPREDVLMVYLTSHGSEDHVLLVDLQPLPLDSISSDDLAGILDEQAFRWKVVVVNACYSGGFIPPLKGAGTLVMTAARADRSSFGCGSESRITYFGDAFLARALNRSDDFIDAFAAARSLIAGWEKHARLTPSQPQIDVGDGIAAQLAKWREGITPGPALPFKPAADARQQR
jgi:hypothetical protein